MLLRRADLALREGDGCRDMRDERSADQARGPGVSPATHEACAGERRGHDSRLRDRGVLGAVGVRGELLAAGGSGNG